jgi:hypothetical protein
MKHPLLKLSLAGLAFCAFCCPIHVHAATVTWIGGSGDWDTATNWSTGQLPGPSDDVVIGAGASITVTHSSGTDTVNSIQNEQTFVLSGGSLAVSSTVQADGPFTVDGGTFTLSGGITSSNFVLAGGTLTGNGVIAGVLTWTSGVIGGGSTLTIATNGTLILAGVNGSDYALVGILTNAGTIELVSGNLQLQACGGPGQLINLPGGVVNLQGDVNIDNCGPGLLVNEGTLEKTGGTGTSTISPVLDNSGLVDVQTGTVNVNGGGSGSGQFSAETGATLAFPNGYTANSGAVCEGAGTNVLTGGTFTVDGLVTISNLVLAGGDLTGNGVIAGVLTWTGGSIGSGSTLTIATNGTLILAGVNGDDYALEGILTNAGTIELVSGNLRLANCSWEGGWSGELVNLPGAVVDLQGDVNIDIYCGGQLVNEGTLAKTGGTGTSTISPVLDNSGLVDVQTGTVNVNGGGSGNGQFIAETGATLTFANNYTGNSGAVFVGAGTNLLSGGTLTVNGSITTSNLVLEGGTLTVNGLITSSNLVLAGGDLTGNGVIAGVLTWTGGTIGSGSTLTIATNGTLILAGVNGDDYALEGILTNAGTIELVSGNLRLANCSWEGGWSGELVNLPGAVVDLQGDVNIDIYCGGQLVNEGTLAKTGGTGTSTISPVLDNSGLVDVQTGTVNVNGGGSGNGQFIAETGATLTFANNYTGNSGAVFVGAGTNLLSGGTLTVNGSITTSNLVLEGGTLTVNGLITSSNLVLAGGDLTGNGVIAGVLTWTGGTIGSGSTLTIATNGTLILAGVNGDDYALEGILTNAGTIELVSGNLRLANCSWEGGWSGELVNLPGAVVDLQGDVNIDIYCGGQLVNEGTLAKTGGTGTSTISPVLDNSGLVDVQTGTVNVNGGDTGNSTGVFQTESGATLTFGNNFTFSAGVQFPGLGTNVLTSGAFTLDGPLTITNLEMTGGTLTVNGAVTISNAVLAGGSLTGSGVIAGVLTWTGGTIGGGSTLTIATNGTLILAGENGNEYLVQGILTNAGTIELDSGNLQLHSCTGYGELINLPGAVVDLQGDVNIDIYCGGQLVNEGTLAKTGGTGTSTISPVLDNSGLVDVQTGTVNVNGGDTGNSTGVFQTESGATLTFGNNFTFSAGVQFPGLGTNVLTSGAFTLDGPLTITNLEMTGGTLTVNGAVTISNAVLAGGSLTGSGVIAGVLTWTGGTIGGGSTLTIATNGTLILAGENGNEYLVQGILTNAGTIELDSGNLQLHSCTGYGELINLPGAVVDLQGDVNIDIYCGGLLVNEGTLEKTGGTGASTISPTFNNTGTLNIESGTLSLTGGYTLNNCTLNFSISSANSFGQLVLNAAFTLNATTLGVIANGYTPSAGDSFPLITYTSETGIFSAFNLPPNANWQPSYGNTAFSLIVSSVTAPYLTLLPVAPVQPTNGVTLLMLGPPNANYTIQSTTNLATPSWVPVTNFFMTNSSFYYTDTNAIQPLCIFEAVMHNDSPDVRDQTKP